ncbi:MAG TPA: hypothetical protein VMK05_04080 [Burkholderiales bacterium]|nr:hypothetical protein [Burkholderiales bacterium]
MSLLIHATLQVAGEPAQIEAFRARVALALASEPVAGSIEERQSGADLVYDIKVTGGIPFPPFAAASAEFPAITVRAQWINAATGERGSAVIANGTLTDMHVEALDSAPAGGDPVYVEVDAGGRLRLALALLQTGRDEFHGYVTSADRDAMFRATRSAGGDRAELLVTAGSAEWVERWSGDLRRQRFEHFEHEAIEPPQPVAAADYEAVERLAREFAGEWLWFADSAQHEVAIERDRYAKYGYAVQAANVRSRQLRRLVRVTVEGGERMAYDALAPDDRWLKDLLARCWAESE